MGCGAERAVVAFPSYSILLCCMRGRRFCGRVAAVANQGSTCFSRARFQRASRQVYSTFGACLAQGAVIDRDAIRSLTANLAAVDKALSRRSSPFWGRVRLLAMICEARTAEVLNSPFDLGTRSVAFPWRLRNGRGVTRCIGNSLPFGNLARLAFTGEDLVGP